MFYRKCQYCGAYLDPGEHCNCQEEEPVVQKKEKTETWPLEKMVREEKNGQLRLAV